MTYPDVLVLHGALGAAEQMHPVAEALAPLGRVDLVEFPGHGRTPPGDGPFTIAGFVHALAQRLDGRDAAATRPFVFGYSMGGYVALALEAERPGTFAGVVTLGTKFAWTPELAARDAARLDPATIRAKVPRFAEKLDALHRLEGGWEGVLERTASLLAALGAAPPLTPGILARVACPVTIAVGEKDDTVGVDEAQEIAAHMPNARAVAIAGAPHPIERVRMDRVHDLMRDHLAWSIAR